MNITLYINYIGIKIEKKKKNLNISGKKDQQPNWKKKKKEGRKPISTLRLVTNVLIQMDILFF